MTYFEQQLDYNVQEKINEFAAKQKQAFTAFTPQILAQATEMVFDFE